MDSIFENGQTDDCPTNLTLQKDSVSGAKFAYQPLYEICAN